MTQNARSAQPEADRSAKTEAETDVRRILSDVHTIAVLGMKQDESCDAFRVPAYMQAQGYRVLPVNPKIEQTLGESAVDSLGELAEPIDLVNVFRAAEHLPSHADEILAMSPRPRAVWLQLGIHHGPTARRLRDAGIEVVQDSCIMVEHKRLMTPERREQAT